MLKELLFAFRSLPDEMNKRVDSVVIRAHRPVEGPDGSAVCTNHWHGTQPWPCSAIRDRFPVGK